MQKERHVVFYERNIVADMIFNLFYFGNIMK